MKSSSFSRMLVMIFFVSVCSYQQRYQLRTLASASSSPSSSIHGTATGNGKSPSTTRVEGFSELHEQDLEVWEIIKDEHERQRTGIELIASENFCSTAVMEALGS